MSDQTAPSGASTPHQVRTFAEARLRAGDRSNALAAYRTLVDMVPDDADAWFNLGYLLRHEGDPEGALVAYRHALSHGVSRPEEVHLNCAALLSDHLDQYDAARDALRDALLLVPDYAPALLNLGNLQEEHGERDAAAATYARLIALAPSPSNHAHRLQALARLTHVAPPSTLSDPALRHLQTASSMPISDASLHATLQFALGRAYDHLEEHSRAFRAFSTANLNAHRGHPTYRAGIAQRVTDEILATFDQAVEIQAAPTGVAPLFVCGMFRSGSTLLEQVLAVHPQIVAGGELDVLPRLVRERLQPYPGSASTQTPADYRTLAESYLAARDARIHPPRSARYVTDKRLDNIAHIGLIKRMFPDAKVLHTRRHPMATGLSVFMQHINPARFSYAGRLDDIGHQIGEQQRLMAHWQRLYPDDIHVFDYDEFVASPEATLRALFRFLDLPWHADCLQFHRSVRVVKTASYWQIRQPLHDRASGHWRHYQAWLDPLAGALRRAGITISEPGSSVL